MSEVEVKRSRGFLRRELRVLFYTAIVIIGLLTVLFTALVISCGHLPLNAHERLAQAGQYLVSRSLDGTAYEMLKEKNRLPHAVAVGPGLAGKLDSLRAVFATSRVLFEVRRGDAEYPLGHRDGVGYPLGRGGCGYQLYFVANGTEVLALRVGYNLFQDKFEIWGYWTPTP
jgi:hypothetical protein